MKPDKKRVLYVALHNYIEIVAEPDKYDDNEDQVEDYMRRSEDMKRAIEYLVDDTIDLNRCLNFVCLHYERTEGKEDSTQCPQCQVDSGW